MLQHKFHVFHLFEWQNLLASVENFRLWWIVEKKKLSDENQSFECILDKIDSLISIG